MDKLRLNYIKGLIWFVFAIIFTVALFTTPDGRPFFYRLLALFIMPSFALGFWTAFFLICAVIAAFLAVMYWKRCVSGFKDLKSLRYILPVAAVVIVAVLGVSNMLYPTFTPIIDRVYFSSLARRSGVQAVTFTWHSYSSRLTGGPQEESRLEYAYDITFHNHSSTAVEFNAQVMKMNFGVAGLLGGGEILPQHRIYDREATGPVLFTVDAGNYASFFDEVTLDFGTFVGLETDIVQLGYGHHFLALTCASTGERHEITPLVRMPPFSRNAGN